MEIREEIRLSKGDKLPKSSSLPDSDQNKQLNNPKSSLGVKAIDCVSPIKSKSKVTGKSNSPKSRWIPMSKRVLSPQPVTQYNPITGEVRKESEKAAVVKGNSVVSKSKVGKSKVATVVSEKSTVVKESVVKSIEKSTIVKESDVTSKVGKSNVSAVVSEKSVVDEKDNPKVSKVSDESNKAAVVAPVIEKVPVATESVKAPVAKESVKAPVVAADAPVNAAVESLVEKDNPKVTSKVSDESVKAPVVKESVKVPVVKKSVKASSVAADKSSSIVADKVDVVKDNINVVADKVVKENVLSVVVDKASNINVVAVADKASDALKNKPAGKGKKTVVGKDKDKPKNIAPDVVKENFKPNPKQKVISSKIPVLRMSKQKENPEYKAKVNVKRKMILSKEDDRKKKLKGNSKKDVSDSELETDVVDYSSDEADIKRKKLKSKAGLKRKRSGSDSSELDTKSIKLLISKLEKKVKKQESDEESVPKKGKKKLTKKVEKEESDEESVPKKGKKKEKQLTPKEAAHEEYLSSFPSFHARTTPSFLFSAIGNSRVDILGFLTDIGFSSLHNVSLDHLPSKLGWFADAQRSCIMIQAIKLREVDHEFVRKWAGQFYPLELKKVRADGLKGQICLDVVRRLREDSVISDIDWCGYIYDCLRDSKLPGGTNHYLGPLTFLILLYLDSTKFDKFPVVRTRPAIRNWSSYLMKQRQELELKDRVVGLLDLHDEWNEAEVQESEGFIGFSETSEKELSLICAERVMLEDYMRKASLKCPGNRKFVALHEKYVNLFKDPISFKDDGNGDEEDVNEGDKDPNRSNLSFGFNKIRLEDFGNDRGPAEKDKVGDLFGDNSTTLEAMNQEITPEKLPTQKASPNPKKRVVKPSSYLLSPYMNKKTKVVPKITRLEFILRNSLFAMPGDKMVIQSKSHESHSESYVIYSESHVIHSESHVIHFESHVGRVVYIVGIKVWSRVVGGVGSWMDVLIYGSVVVRVGCTELVSQDKSTLRWGIGSWFFLFGLCEGLEAVVSGGPLLFVFFSKGTLSSGKSFHHMFNVYSFGVILWELCTLQQPCFGRDKKFLPKMDKGKDKEKSKAKGV
ncbi:hypothetical protein Tco_0412501 [Tanacetum coccineum]